MKIVDVVKHSEAELIAKMRQVRLRGFGQPEVYRDCYIELRTIRIDIVSPPQNYYLASRVQGLVRLYVTVKEKFGFDLFDYHGYCEIVFEDGTKMPFMPPVVETFLSGTVGGVLVCDGVHRMMAKRAIDSMNFSGTPAMLVVRVSKPDWPYYAVVDPALTWDRVERIEGELPDAYRKKTYRIPVESGSGVTTKAGGDGFAAGEAAYKLLFRDFNAVWPGVQEERKKGLVG